MAPRARLGSLEQALHASIGDLAALGVRVALIGGLAVSARAEPRLTRDVDLAVAVADDREAEAIVHALVKRGYRLRALLEQRRTGRIATARLLAPGDRRRPVTIDLLFASSGIERDVVKAAATLEIGARLRVRVARVGDLLALKVLARDDRRRPQDYDDILALLDVATATEIRRAVRALRWIEERGFARGRSLIPAFGRARRQWAATRRREQAAAR